MEVEALEVVGDHVGYTRLAGGGGDHSVTRKSPVLADNTNHVKKSNATARRPADSDATFNFHLGYLAEMNMSWWPFPFTRTGSSDSIIAEPASIILEYLSQHRLSTKYVHV